MCCRLTDLVEEERAAKETGAELASSLQELVGELQASFAASEAAKDAATAELHMHQRQVSLQGSIGLCCHTGTSCCSGVEFLLSISASSTVGKRLCSNHTPQCTTSPI